jgi:hypothetical protein
MNRKQKGVSSVVHHHGQSQDSEGCDCALIICAINYLPVKICYVKLDWPRVGPLTSGNTATEGRKKPLEEG